MAVETFGMRQTAMSFDSSVKRRAEIDTTIYCACGFTCGTQTALDRHIKKFADTADAGQHVRQTLPPVHPAAPKTVDATPAFRRRRASSLVDSLPSPTRANIDLLSPTTPADMSIQMSLRPSPGSSCNITPRTLPVSLPNGNQRPPMRLLIVRHAQSANKALMHGQKPSSNPGLTDSGHAQAAALGSRLANEFKQPEKRDSLLVVSSPMRRCLLTILPAVKQLSLNPAHRLVHGGCFEYGCAGTAYAGTTTAEIKDEFPEFQPVCFNDKGTWDYRGDNMKENEIDCLSRAARIVEWCQHDAREIIKPHIADKVTPTIILCLHQTISDLLCQLFVDGTSNKWAYGDIKYSLHNAGMTEIFLHPDGRATFGAMDDDYHVVGFRRRPLVKSITTFY